MTKEERREYMKKYRAENREQINANKRYWLKRNPERAKKMEYIKKPLAWALFQVWKKVDSMKGGE